MRLMSSESPCSSSRKKPIGISRRTGQRMSPPGFGEVSLETQAFMNTGQDSVMVRMTIGSMKTMMPKTSIQFCERADRRPVTMSIRMCSLRLKT